MNLFNRMLFSGMSVLMCPSCSKSVIDSPITVIPKDTVVVISPAIEPKIAATMGFFLDNWQPKNFIVPPYIESSVAEVASNTVTIDASDIITKIPSQIFGHNSNTWMGTFVDTPSFITDITNLKPNIIRWPAGSGSDGYFWNATPVQDPNNKNRQIPGIQYMKDWGIPNQYMDKDGKLSDSWFFYGQTTDNWRASLSNYYDMLQRSNNKGVITINYGFARYGTSKNPVATAAHLAADWVRYDKGRTEYWEIGNENYGDWEAGYRIDVSKNQDGQPEFLTGGLYAKHFKVYADSMRKAAAEIGVKIKIGAVTQESPTQSWQTNTTKTWNSTMIPELNNKADFYIVHNYITPYDQNSNAPAVLNGALTVPEQMMNFVSNEITSNGAELKPIAFTEWNMWAKDSKQQVSNTSGLFAIIVQGEAIKNKYGLAARWDLLNGWDGGNDHGLFSDGGSSDDPRWNARPSFYYMYYFQKCIGDRLVSSNVVLGSGNAPSSIKAYASTYSSGQMNVTLVNASGSPEYVEVKTKNFRVGNRFYWYSLEGSNDNGQFSRKVLINGSGPKGAAGGPADYTTIKAKSALTTNGMKVVVPAWGAVSVMIDKK
ncbi:MAG: alpha-L-arabinofuranosidase [Bacteroidota bacterium]